MTEHASPGDRNGLTWDEHGQPYSTQFDDVYFSKASGISESRYVFIDHNQLTERFAALAPAQQFVVGETGFGTGLNFLACWQSWREHANANACLHFVSIEKFPLNRQQLRQALALWPELTELAAQLIDAYPPMPARGFQRLVFDQGKVQLTLILADAAAGLQQLLPLPSPADFPQAAACNATWGGARELRVDAWFLDGFAPAKNPDMWTPALFEILAQLSGPGTSFATFTAAGIVKRGLQQVGFEICKVPGFGHKRHMLCGRFVEQPNLATANPDVRTLRRRRVAESPWHLVAIHVHARQMDTGHLDTSQLDISHPNPNQLGSSQPASNSTVSERELTDSAAAAEPALPRRQALIVGAGLAGCHTARALAERGYQITVIDRGSLASGASGNPQGVVYAKASSQDQPLTNFNLTALQFACHYYRDRFRYQECGEQSGVFYLAQTTKQVAEYQALAERYAHEPQFVQWLDREAASEACGLPLAAGGLLFSQAGWLQPRELCRALLDHPTIRLVENAPAGELTHEQGLWQARGPDGSVLAEAPIAVLANATDATQHAQTAHLPLKAIRGQISQLPATAVSRQLRRVLCGKGYIAPALPQGEAASHCVGASFNLDSTETAADPADDLENLSHVAELSPALANQQDAWQQVAGNRVAFRCATPDYLPVVGPAPIATDMLSRFAALRHNAQQAIDAPGSYYPGLYINVGHGSRGLAYTPLCAELLASMISGAPLPLSHDMTLRLHPARFLVRDIKRNRH